METAGRLDVLRAEALINESFFVEGIVLVERLVSMLTKMIGMN
jgi:hypothetical protein